jgi:hypothetical protein
LDSYVFSFDWVRWRQLRRLRSQSVLFLAIRFMENASEALCFVSEFGLYYGSNFFYKSSFFFFGVSLLCYEKFEFLFFVPFLGVKWVEGIKRCRSGRSWIPKSLELVLRWLRSLQGRFWMDSRERVCTCLIAGFNCIMLLYFKVNLICVSLVKENWLLWS